MNYNLRKLIDNVKKDKGFMLNDLIDMGIVNLDALVKEVISTKDVHKIHFLLMNLKTHNLFLEGIIEEAIATKDIGFIVELTSLMNFLGYKELVYKLSLEVLNSDNLFAMIHLAQTIPGVSFDAVFNRVLASDDNLQVIVSLLKRVDFNKEDKDKLPFDIYVEKNSNKLLEVILKPENLDFLVQTRQELKDATIISYFNQFIADMVKQSIQQTDLFTYLLELYQKEDFETIRNNREIFSTLFKDEDEEITRGM